MCENEQKPELEPEPWKKELRSRSHTHENQKLRSWSRSHVHEKRAPEPELCHVYDGSTALKKVFHDEKKTTTFIQS